VRPAVVENVEIILQAALSTTGTSRVGEKALRVVLGGVQFQVLQGTEERHVTLARSPLAPAGFIRANSVAIDSVSSALFLVALVALAPVETGSIDRIYRSTGWLFVQIESLAHTAIGL